ncbi:Ribosome bioproteinsis protein 1 [Chamberlinius hualienensis]
MGKSKLEGEVTKKYTSEDGDSDSSSVYSGLSSEENDVEDDSDVELTLIQNKEENNEKEDEYAKGDSSDEEDVRNTVGNIPMKWYDEYQHLGYDWDGQKISKPVKSDELEKFLNRMENPDYWRTVHDPSTGQDVVLADEDVEVIQRIQKGLYPDREYDAYAPWIDFFSHEVSIHPVTNRPEHKRSFIPSLIEKEKVSKLVHAIKMGWLKPKTKTEDEDLMKVYQLWADDDQQTGKNKRLQHYIPAPKMKLPGHSESYNPPAEYLFDQHEEEKWRNQDELDRKLDFIPQKFSALRHVPAYDSYTQDFFQRCLDLYLCPRERKMRLNVNPEDLIPKLPKPKDLHPFPTQLALAFKGHKGMVRSISIEPSGQFFASGSDDCTVKVWEIRTARCIRTITLEGPVTNVAWCPNTNASLIAAATGKTVVIFNPNVGDRLVISNTDLLFHQAQQTNESTSSSGNDDIQWLTPNEQQLNKGYKIVVCHPKPVSRVTWHCKGDYFAAVMPGAGSKSVFIHLLSKRTSLQPFKRNKGLIQTVLFHPARPLFFVATQQHVRVYNLLKQEMVKKLMTNCKWVSSMAIHSGGDNVIKAIRSVAYHKRYPLFASASDDCSVIISHGMVYNDLLQNPLIVHVKILHGHQSVNDIGVLDCQFHPTQPWILTSGADSHIFLYT